MDGWIGLSGCGKWMESGCGLSGCECGKWRGSGSHKYNVGNSFSNLRRGASKMLRNTTFIDVYLLTGEHARARQSTNLLVEAR